MIQRPKELNVPQLDPLIRDYIVDLEEVVFKIANDSVGNLYMALRGQIDGIAKILDQTYITDISDKDDKVFDRIIKLSTDSRKIVENMKYLEAQMNPDNTEIEPEEGSVEGFVKGLRGKKNVLKKV
jgi:trehalose/maltose hydrolase-like predicted phosphorylase